MEIVALIGAFASIAAAIIGFAAQDYTSSKTEDLAKQNLQQNKEVAQQNFELSQQQFDYQKELNELIMQREDTAFQRQVADLKAAGLSPLNIAGGSPATPLTSANAPQFDMSGINQAFQGMIGAYNDSFNRKIASQQFALQSKAQTAQIYTQLAENYRDQKQAQLEYKYLDEKLKWEKKHGFRDVNWKSDITQMIENWLDQNKSSVLPSLSNGNGKTLKDQILEGLGINSLDDSPQIVESPVDNPNFINLSDLEAQTNYNTKKLHDKQAKDYKLAQNIIETNRISLYGKDKKITQAVDFIYRHTKAHEDYSTVYLFVKALKENKKLARQYELLEVAK